MKVFEKKKLDDKTALALSKFILESERISKDAKELNNQLTYQFSDRKNCYISFESSTGIPTITFSDRTSFGYSYVKLDLDEIRILITWLKQRGIE